ncbi:MAG: putative periplasmic serine endoprotease DegP-like precursor [Candidatus Accumulibacter regalis]|uniref:Periplasmic serine endoprotease DegP-like n=1 Tax=Accumulibacter regalis TaxID=522306 RepID=A0A011QCU8_ACCRE|nr:MAG: putative periplasmic serine endoprotease DegP-like precursor [Candidatus Accumulibacter regalis]
MKRTLYHILGVDSKASFQEIRLAYQTRLDALATRPTSDPNALGLLRHAYHTLSSPSSRSTYDASLLNAVARATKQRVVRDARSSGLWWLVLCAIILVVSGIVWTLRSSARPPLPLPASVGAPPPKVIEKATLQAEPDPSSSANASDALDAPTTTRSAVDVFSDVSPSIARIVATDRSSRTQAIIGSGVVIGSGTVVTNCHVVARAGPINARVGTDIYEATVTVADEELDLCLLSVPGLPAPAVDIGSVDSLRTGQRVYAVGAPYGFDLTISEGIVSSLRDVAAGTVIQTTAAVSPGSSGGGLFNLSGQLVGIVTFQHRYGQNLNFAHPADWIAQMRTRAPSLKAATPSPRPQTTDPLAPPLPRVGDSPDVLIVGSWWCIGGMSFPNGEFHFRSDGTFTAILPRRGDSGSYSVIGGKFVNFDIRGQHSSLVIQNITTTILVLKKADYSDWLTCSRK